MKPFLFCFVQHQLCFYSSRKYQEERKKKNSTFLDDCNHEKLSRKSLKHFSMSRKKSLVLSLPCVLYQTLRISVIFFLHNQKVIIEQEKFHRMACVDRNLKDHSALTPCHGFLHCFPFRCFVFLQHWVPPSTAHTISG